MNYTEKVSSVVKDTTDYTKKDPVVITDKMITIVQSLHFIYNTLSCQSNVSSKEHFEYSNFIRDLQCYTAEINCLLHTKPNEFESLYYEILKKNYLPEGLMLCKSK